MVSDAGELGVGWWRFNFFPKAVSLQNSHNKWTMSRTQTDQTHYHLCVKPFLYTVYRCRLTINWYAISSCFTSNLLHSSYITSSDYILFYWYNSHWYFQTSTYCNILFWMHVVEMYYFIYFVYICKALICCFENTENTLLVRWQLFHCLVPTSAATINNNLI